MDAGNGMAGVWPWRIEAEQPSLLACGRCNDQPLKANFDIRHTLSVSCPPTHHSNSTNRSQYIFAQHK